MSCFTCFNVVENAHPNLVYLDDIIVVNHHIDGSADSSEPRPGWFIVSPRRCVTRLHELNAVEQTALLAAVSFIDGVLTNEFGATRTLTASLGVNVSDHIHFHVVPTFDPPGEPTAKWKMFQGHKEPIYRPAPCFPQEVSQLLRAAFSSLQCSQCRFMSPLNRESQAVFRCVKCGHTCNADLNVAGSVSAGRGSLGRTRHPVEVSDTPRAA